MNRWFELLLRICFVGVLCLASTVARADALSDYEKARNSYAAGRYDEAAQRFDALVHSGEIDDLPDPKMREQARIYHVACLLALGKNEQAEKLIEKLIRAHPDVSPDPVLFPTVVLDKFSDVRARIRQELEAEARKKAAEERKRRLELAAKRKRELEKVKKLQKIASRDTCTSEHSRWLATIPFGVGQFQNGQKTLGWVFLTSETALAIGTIVTSSIYQSLESKGQERNVDRVELNERLSLVRTYNQAMFGTLVATMVGGIIHAHLTFVPSHTTVQPHPLPKELQIVPDAMPTNGGVLLGIHGTF